MKLVALKSRHKSMERNRQQRGADLCELPRVIYPDVWQTLLDHQRALGPLNNVNVIDVAVTHLLHL